MNCQVSRATYTDLQLMQRFFYQTVTIYGSQVFSKEEIRIFSRLALDKEYWEQKFEEDFIYNAKLNGEIIGSFSMDKTGTIMYLFVHMGYHGRGVARQLYDKMLEVARNYEIEYLTTKVNEITRSFFEKKGFEIVQNAVKASGGEEMISYKAIKKL